METDDEAEPFTDVANRPGESVAEGEEPDTDDEAPDTI